MKRNVLAVLLAASALAGADGGEFLLGFDAFYIAAAHDQLTPAVASSGTNSLIVWRDNRNGDADIYGARLIEQAVQGYRRQRAPRRFRPSPPTEPATLSPGPTSVLTQGTSTSAG